MKWRKWLTLLLGCIVLFACQETGPDGGQLEEVDFLVDGYAGETLTIVAGSENQVLEPIIQDYAQEAQQNIAINYLGSLDIMRLLQTGEVPYDAVWPASSLWLDMGDDHNLVKHAEITSVTPVVFGVRRSLAQDLGWVDRGDVTIEEIIQAIADGDFSFAMTSATQSNSGASAYLGFLTALADNSDGLTSEDLMDPDLQQQITTLLSGVDRSSGSSNWLVDLILQGDYDAMVNYEQLIIQANQALEDQGREPLYAVYPVDGLSISDSPLAFIDREGRDMEEIFLDFQAYLLSDPAQDRIEQTGKRSNFGTVRPGNEAIFKEEWGIILDQVLSPIRLPHNEVIVQALNLYQTEFKKPSLTVYVLDFSGSMSGEGNASMMAALDQVLIPEHAASHLLLGTPQDLTHVLAFSSGIDWQGSARGNGQELEDLYDQIDSLDTGGGTALFEATAEAVRILDGLPEEDLDRYQPAIVLLTDGRAGDSFRVFQHAYQEAGMDVPVFSIMFGDAQEDELADLAALTRGRVFDGRTDLIEAFRKVRGYN